MPNFRPRLARKLVTSVLVALVATSLAACGSNVRTAPTQPGPPAHPTTLTDVLGRTVTLNLPSSRILLGGSRFLYTMAMLNKADPTAHVVGWPDDLEQNDPDTYQRYLQRFPAISKIPTVGQLPNGSLSVEQGIDLRPDVFVVSAFSFKAAQDAGIVGRLQDAGVPTVVLDYFVDPLRNTVPSVRLMGQIMGRSAEAENYISYYQAAVQKVRTRLDNAHQPPTPAFLWRAPGYYDCCATFARSNLGSMVTFAGGDNLADSLLNTQQGTLAPETVLTRNPPVVIATGADWAPGTPAKQGEFVALGYNESQAQAQAQLRAVLDRQAGFDNLAAVQNHRMYVVWHHFYDSPYNYLAIEWFAKWLHPDLFTDVDPDASMRDLQNRFLPIAPGGTFWAGVS
jgi:iron complex transport system substrate-binding protein